MKILLSSALRLDFLVAVAVTCAYQKIDLLGKPSFRLVI